MKIIATSGMGTKFVATLDKNNDIDKMSRYADFSGGNKDSKGGSYRNPNLWGNYIEVSDDVESVTNDLSNTKSGSRVFVNCSTSVSKSYKRKFFKRTESIEMNDFVNNLPKEKLVKVSIEEGNEEYMVVDYSLITGYTAGNELCEVDLTTLTKKTCEVFSARNPNSRRKINIKQFSFLVLNY